MTPWCIHCRGVENPWCWIHQGIDMNWFTKNPLVQNTRGNQDSPVIKTLGSLYSLFYFSPESFFVNLFWCLFEIHQVVYSQVYSSQGSWDSLVYFTTGVSGLPRVFTTRELRLPSEFINGETFERGKLLTNFKEHTTICKGIIILKIDCRLF
jgi:hypothetical protein